MEHPAQELIDQAAELVDMIRAQNWKNGGVLNIDRDEAASVIQQLVRAAYSKGAVDGSREMGDRLIKTANAVLEKAS